MKWNYLLLKKIIGLLALWKGFILLAAILALLLLPWRPTFTASVTEAGQFQPYFFSIWANFDGVHYLKIGLRGYESLTQPFFPLYPLAVGILSRILHIHVLYAGLILTHIFLAAALFVIWKLLKKDGISNPLTCIVLILAYPTSFYYGCTYNDALFLLCACLCLLAARHKAWGWASLAAAAATLTRFNGLALAPFLALEYLSSDQSVVRTWQIFKNIPKYQKLLHPKALWQSQIWLGWLVPLSFLGYLAYVQVIFGSWRSLFTTMSIWNQSQTVFPLRVLWRYIKIVWLHSPLMLNYWVAVVELLAILFSLFMLFWSWRKIRLSYWFFFAISLLIPALTGTFQGMPRYALHLYPFFLALTFFWQKSYWPTKLTYVLFSIIIFLFGICLFTRGYFFS